MADLADLDHNLPFESVSDDDLFDLLRPNQANNQPFVNFPGSFDEIVAENLNSSSQELNLNFDLEDPAQHSFSKYITNAQFYDIIKDFNSDTFSLLHFNIRSLNKHFDELQSFLR